MENKKEILKTIIIIWVFAATSYVAWDLWNDYKVKGIQAAYRQGQFETLSQLIGQVEKSNCQSFEVSNGEKQAQLLNAECMSQPSAPTME